MKHHLEYKDSKSRKFWQITKEKLSIIITFGKIGTEGKTQSKSFDTEEKAGTYYQKQLFKKVDTGYLSKDLQYEIKAFGELGIQDNLQSSIDPDEQCIVFKNNAVIPHSLLLDYNEKLLYNEERSIAGIYAEGDLIVEGSIYNAEMDFGPFLIVNGDLKVNSLLCGGSEMIIKGNLEAKYIAHKYNHGYIEVKRTTKAQLAVCEFWEGLKFANYTGYAFTAGYDEVETYSNNKQIDDETYSSSDLLKAGGNIMNFISAMYQDKPLLKENALTIQEKITKLLQKKLEKPDSVKRLSLENKGLKEIPKEIFQFKNLEELNINQNIISSLPAEIKGFSKLKRLFFSDNKFEVFPMVITEIETLESIEAEGNHFKHIPEEIGNLTNLRSLNLYRNALLHLPKILSSCSSLERINLRQQETGIWDIPKYDAFTPSNFLEILATLPNLKYFDVDWNPIIELPDSPFVSQNLQEISIKGTLIKNSSVKHPFVKIDTESSVKRITDKIKELSKFSETKDKELSAEFYAKKLTFAIEMAAHFFDTYDEIQSNFEEELSKYFENRTKSLSDSYHHLKSCLEEVQNLTKKYSKNELVQSIHSCVKDLYERESIFHEGYENIPLPELGSSKNYLYDVAQRYFKIRARHVEKFEKIEVRFFTLNAEIPSEIFNLTNVKHLSLKNCHITGIPEEISKLKNLEILDLEYNNIEDIPQSILELKHLKTLILNYNPISTIPDELRSIKSKIKL
ncbi:leucine-rich repeat domain-containing protein [Aquimarina mytili]|uniref:Leucine-rich repeat domain-containing protein n=1 Tax=Aquimarina mytili TaxID=874423 RepID=A0A936ZN98_9FLAO|nr:leucine-rich repeat domain-containing protein [Aquimarina mytili]MBL0682754.1 leucine-rich repeat domain-containing protein [Aquimarina mytili]